MSRPQRWTILIVLLGLGGTLAWFAWSASATARRAAEARRLLDDLAAEVASRPCERPTLSGEALSGNAWDAYIPALEADPRDENTVLEHLHAGARQRRAEYPGAPNRANEVHPDRLLAACTARAKFLRDDGRTAAAIELLLDVSQFLRDWDAAPVTQWNALLSSKFDSVVLIQLRELLPTLPPQTCRRLADALGVLDETSPPREFIHRNIAAVNARRMLKLEESGGVWRQRAFPFTPARREMADAVMFTVAAAGRAAAAETRPWREADPLLDALDSELFASTNRLVRENFYPAWRLSVFLRVRQAHRRLIRTAAHWKATGEVLELGDPFGTTLRHAFTAAGLRVWSVGRDGDDGRPRQVGRRPGRRHRPRRAALSVDHRHASVV